MNRYISMFALAMGSILQTAAYTPAETNAVVEAALDYLQQVYPDNWETNFIEMADEEIPDTWINFLGGDETNGWTHAEKRAAFDWYLDSLGTTDCQQLSAIGKRRVRAALGQCDVLNHTNSWPYLRALALNPHGICREEAIELAIKFGTVNDDMTGFVEMIVTNVTGYTRSERGSSACGHYIDKILACEEATNTQDSAAFRALKMFYRNRCVDVAGSVALDVALKRLVSGYEASSNRLENAQFVLEHPACRPFDRQYFTPATNLLLSAPQPLPEVEVLRGL